MANRIPPYHHADGSNCWTKDCRFRQHDDQVRQEIMNSVRMKQSERNTKSFHAFSMDVTDKTNQVLDTIEEAGFTPYIVGGSVRDALFGKQPKDIDIEVYGADADTLASSLQPLGSVDTVGKSFGVIKLTCGSEDFDISLPRRDSKRNDSEGHKAFDVQTDPDMTEWEASNRRDFTVNTLMFSRQRGGILDLHKGLDDLKHHRLRHVSQAFSEDPLRVLRGAQMCARFGLTADRDTIRLCESLRNEFSTLPESRVREEFSKMFHKGKDIASGFKFLHDTRWDENFSGLREVNTPIFRQGLNRLRQQPERSVTSIGYVSAHLNHANAKEFAYQTAISKVEAERSVALGEVCRGWVKPQSDDYHVYKMASELRRRRVSIELYSEIMKAHGDNIQPFTSRARELGVFTNAAPDIVTGKLLMRVYPERSGGAWMGKIINDSREAQYRGLFADETAAARWLKKNH